MGDYQPSLSIKSWAEDDRPREKLLLKGRSALSNVELIAILIGSGSRNESAVDLSKRILQSVNNNLTELGKLTIQDLMKFKGIGEAKAISITAALELGRRRKKETPQKKQKITSSNDIYEIFHPHLADLPHEEFWVLLLSRSNTVKSKHCISKGGITGTVADIRIIFKLAIENLAASIIACHNHPSGNLHPSKADLDLTKKLKQTGETMEIHVLDHVIVTDNGYYSFADEGKL